MAIKSRPQPQLHQHRQPPPLNHRRSSRPVFAVLRQSLVPSHSPLNRLLLQLRNPRTCKPHNRRPSLRQNKPLPLALRGLLRDNVVVRTKAPDLVHFASSAVLWVLREFHVGAQLLLVAVAHHHRRLARRHSRSKVTPSLPKSQHLPLGFPIPLLLADNRNSRSKAEVGEFHADADYLQGEVVHNRDINRDSSLDSLLRDHLRGAEVS